MSLADGLGSSLTSNIEALTSDPVIETLVQSLGTIFNHRAYEPATPIGSKGWDFGIEVTAVQLPLSVSNTLKKNGLNVTLPPILPNARMLNFHKGIFSNLDIGLSFFVYKMVKIYGGDLKLVFYNPEEGPTWAIRVNYNYLKLDLGTAVLGPARLNVGFSSTTITPELVISKKLDFADPYVGIGYQYIQGGINIGIVSPYPIPPIEASVLKANNLFAFIGLSLTTPFSLRLTFEGSYNVNGYNTLGAKVGFTF